MQKQANQFSASVGSHEIMIEAGKLAGQANGAVTIRVGDTMVFASAVISSHKREGIDFLPLSVDYEERLYAAGKIPGSFFRREGRPGEEAILTARLTDRPLRPLFDKHIRNEIQIIIYSLSADGDHPLDILAVNAASAALVISDIPWDGPVGCVRVGRVDGEFVLNPTYQQLEVSDLDLRVAGTREAILMVESSSDEIEEHEVINAIVFAHEGLQPLIDVQEKMRAEIGKPKKDMQLKTLDEALKSQVFERVSDQISNIYSQSKKKAEQYEQIDELKAQIIEELAGDDEEKAPEVKEAFEYAHKKVVRNRIIQDEFRPDGRGIRDIRDIWCEVDSSPRVHGSGIFTRGETQVFTLATLGTPKEAQELDNLSPENSKRYMHHYNFAPFSTGETKRIYRSRREVGHGALAERALMPVLPDEKDFPYTIRLVSEVLSSNGSTSMASVCGSTLALMDTGVPIKSPVAGIAMGLVMEGDDYKVLTDIQGLEDHLGDMDFKVAGTKQGITALQMDIKLKGVTPEIMKEALTQAKEARFFIIDKITDTIAAPRSELKSFVPRIVTIKIPVDKIGAIIGPGGKTIRSIQEETGVRIDVAEDGTVYIAAAEKEAEKKARERIERLTETPVVGRIYTGKVVRTTNYGAFVEILPGTDGMVHISQLDSERIEKVEDVASVGDEITVMITAIDHEGKIRLSRQAVLEGWTAEEARSHDQKNRRNSGGDKRRRSSQSRRSNH
jgi:polyribonucleotide nucleotidyltransferase